MFSAYHNYLGGAREEPPQMQQWEMEEFRDHPNLENMRESLAMSGI